MASRPRRSASRHSIVKPNQPRSWFRGPDLRRNYLSLFLVQVTISLVGVVLTLASAIAFGNRLQRRRKYDIEDKPSRAVPNPLSLMVTLAPSLCSACVFFVFFLLAYKMMMPKYKRRIFLVSHLFCVVSMVSLSVYAALILMDILKFPNGSIGILDETLEKEIANLQNRTEEWHKVWPLTRFSGKGSEKSHPHRYFTCCGAYTDHMEHIMMREENSYLHYAPADKICDKNEQMGELKDKCVRSRSCFHKDAISYGNRVTLFLFFTVASTVSAVVTVCIVIRQDKKESELPPTEPHRESTRQPAEAAPLLPVVPSTPTEPPTPSPILNLQQ